VAASAIFTSVIAVAGTATSAARLTVTAGVVLSSATAPPNFVLTVSGTGFGAGEGVDVFFDTIDVALAGSDTAGNFGMSVTVPASATPGTHWISAQGRHSGLFAQTTLTVDTEWPQFRNGPEHHAYNVTENVLSPWTVSGMDLNWSFQTGSAVTSSPAVANLSPQLVSQIGLGQLGVVYVGSQDDNVYAIDAATGYLLWIFTTGSQVQSSPAVVGGVVYVGSLDNNLYALDYAGGTKLWNFDTGLPVFSTPVVNDFLGLVYVGSGDMFYALGAGVPGNGAEAWSFPAGMIATAPAVANNVVYFSSTDGNMHALDAGTGFELWSSPGLFMESSPAVATGAVYVGSLDSNVYALNATTGDELWSFPAGGMVSSSPAVANGIVYIGSANYVYALDAATGDELWSFFTEYYVYSSPAVANGMVYIGVGDNVYGLDAASGDELWSFVTGGYVYSSPAVANGMVYVGSGDSNVYELGLASNDT
jgi:eukaryotic-like serine/threonine-protein kinase